MNLLLEKRMNQMISDTANQTPRLASRSDFVTSEYIGMSKFGIFNFRTTSQTNPGYYWFQSIEVPDLASKVIDEDITPEFIKGLLEDEDIKVYCDDPSFLYWALKYKANSNDYGIEPETRSPKRNNTRLMGSNCKHLQSVMELLKTGACYSDMAKDAINWAKYNAGEEYRNFQKTRLNSDKYKKSHRMNYETADSYMNDYFASKAGFNKFLDDEDIKGSLKAEIDRTAKTDPNLTLDEFITDEFGVDGVRGLANELQIDIDYVRQYFKDLGFAV